MTLSLTALIFFVEKCEKLLLFVEKMRKGFSHFFIKKYWRISDLNVLNYSKTLTKDVVRFGQPGQPCLSHF